MKPKIKPGYKNRRTRDDIGVTRKRTIPQVLRAYLDRTGFTCAEAAKAIGDIPLPTFNDWLYGNSTPGAASRALIYERSNPNRN